MAVIIHRCEGTVKEARQEVNKAQLKRVVEWGDEMCPHIIDLEGVGTFELPKRACKKCWQSLLDEVKG